jgi:hypothetical protein
MYFVIKMDRVIILGYFSINMMTREFHSRDNRSLRYPTVGMTVFCGFLKKTDEDDCPVQVHLQWNTLGSAVVVMQKVDEFEHEMTYFARDLIDHLDQNEDTDYHNYNSKLYMEALQFDREYDEWECPFFSVSDSRWCQGGQPFTISDHLFIHRMELEEEYEEDEDEDDEDDDEEDQEDDEDDDEEEEDEEDDEEEEEDEEEEPI